MADTKFSINRQQALTAKPVSAQIIKREDLPDGGLRVTVPFHPRGMQRWLLRLPPNATRDYELDPFGAEILQMCDGEKNVRYIAGRFAKSHKLNEAEAERAVVTFLRTMINKGLVTMLVPKK